MRITHVAPVWFACYTRHRDSKQNTGRPSHISTHTPRQVLDVPCLSPISRRTCDGLGPSCLCDHVDCLAQPHSQHDSPPLLQPRYQQLTVPYFAAFHQPFYGCQHGLLAEKKTGAR
jgi:hypothetical protein